MNSVIDLLKEHRTYRDFDTNYTLPPEQLQAILDAARQAPTWMNGQFYSIIAVTDKGIQKEILQHNPRNPHIESSSVFLVFVADLHRTKLVSDFYGTPYAVHNNLDALLIATTDAALACQNAIVASESLGLGTGVIGTIRYIADDIVRILDLPEYTLPVFGLAIGKPTVEMKVKPRLPQEAVVHFNRYIPYDYDVISNYDNTMETFAEARETKLWSKKFADFFSTESAPQLNEFLDKQNLTES